MYVLYTCVLALGLAVSLPYYAFRIRKYGPGLLERLGFVEGEARAGTIWIHAVSVGEAKMVGGLIGGLRHRFPQRRIAVSTVTATGRSLVLKRQDVDRVIYFPLDFPGSVRRSLNRVRPGFVVVAETEIWPNFLRECKRQNVPVFMVNGRISDRSFPRYRLVRRWLRTVLSGYRLLGVQSETDAQRMRSIGASAKDVVVFGNLKYDLSISDQALDPTFRDALRRWQPLLVAASTTSGEEPIILEAFEQLRRTYPGVKLLLAPRRPERFEEVADMVASHNLVCQRRSCLTPDTDVADVLLLDSIGELALVFEYATLVFVGGSLVPRGGHNVLEPAFFSKPILFGPHMENFRDISRLFLAADAARMVTDIDSLAQGMRDLLTAPADAARMGQEARRVLDENTGATGRFLEAMELSLTERTG